MPIHSIPPITDLRVTPVAGRARVPNKPGLGIENDMAEVGRAHRLYRRQAQNVRGDATAKRFIIRAWKFNPWRHALDRPDPAAADLKETTP